MGMGARVAANLVIGGDGSTTLGGSSAALSFPADRIRFHQLRGDTARREPYSKTPLPLIVLTHHTLPNQVATNPLAIAWHMNLIEAIPVAQEVYGDLIIEAGPALIRPAIQGGYLTELFITKSERAGGEGVIDLTKLLEGWTVLSDEVVAGGHFLHYRLAPSHE
jgi:dihydrofolate reductase